MFRDEIAVMQLQLKEKGKKSHLLTREVSNMPDALTRFD